MSMTREEAVKRLKSLRMLCQRLIVSSRRNPEEWKKDIKALDIALTALRGPTREMVERMRGEWEPYGFDKRGRGGIWHCTQCGKSYPVKNTFCPHYWENECVSKSALIEWLRPYLHTGEPIPADVLISDIQMMSPTLTPQNEPLTIEQLREMDEPVWVACKPIEGGDGYWCLCRHGHITTPAGTFFEVEEIHHWLFYRRPPERQEDI